MAKQKVELTKEMKEPSTTIVCNLKEQKVQLPWVFKAGQGLCEEQGKKINLLFNDRKEWLKPLAEFVITHTTYNPIPEAPFGYDNLRFDEALEMIIDALRAEYRIALGKPKQTKLLEAE